MKLIDKNIMVTGGSGFIGSHLTKQGWDLKNLLKDGVIINWG
jgi:nucleoside-diphosphate-sugar epimerase